MTKPKNLSTICLLFAAVSATCTTSRAQCNCGASAGTALTDTWMMLPGMYGQPIDGNAVYLTLNVPELAIVQINGDPTISIGPTRYYVIRDLEVGRDYKFKIVVETANAAGVAMEETQTVTLKPGNTEVVTMKPKKRKVVTPPAQDSETAVKLNTRMPSVGKNATELELPVRLAKRDFVGT